LAGWTPPRTPLDLDVNPKDGVISLNELRALGANPAVVEPGEAIDALRIYQLNREGNPGLLTFATLAAALHEQGVLPPPVESRTLFYLPDHLGSASAVMDSGGGLVEESVFYPYGKDRVRTGGYESEYRFTGKELDGETGLTYFGARYYDSTAGSFTSVDPAVLDKDKQQISTGRDSPAYSYGQGSPLRYNDPTGLASIDQSELNSGYSKVYKNDDNLAKGYADLCSQGYNGYCGGPSDFWQGIDSMFQKKVSPITYGDPYNAQYSEAVAQNKLTPKEDTALRSAGEVNRTGFELTIGAIGSAISAVGIPSSVTISDTIGIIAQDESIDKANNWMSRIEFLGEGSAGGKNGIIFSAIVRGVQEAVSSIFSLGASGNNAKR